MIRPEAADEAGANGDKPPDQRVAQNGIPTNGSTTIPGSASASASASHEHAWRIHAARLNNVGGLLYQKGGDLLLPAMQFLQEGVQGLMALENPETTITEPPQGERSNQIQKHLEELLRERHQLQKDRIEQQDSKLPAKRVVKKEDEAKRAPINGTHERSTSKKAACRSYEKKATDIEIPSSRAEEHESAITEPQHGSKGLSQQQDLTDASCERSGDVDNQTTVDGKRTNGKHCCATETKKSSGSVSSSGDESNHQASGNCSSELESCNAVSSSGDQKPAPQHHSENSTTTEKPQDSAAAALDSTVKQPPREQTGASVARASLPSSETSQSTIEARAETRKRRRISNMLSQFDSASSDTKKKDASHVLLDHALDEESATQTVIEHTNFLLGGIPGLFPMTSKMKGAEKKNEKSMLVFSEPFLVDVDHNDEQSSKDGKLVQPVLREGPDAGAFCVPLDHCSRACLFNMGLVHYQWNSPDSAIQFFELSLSLAPQQPSLLTFDPIVLACVNNVGQILLQQKGKVAEAKGMFSDALSRGNSALVELYRNEGKNSNGIRQSPELAEVHKLTSRLLRRFLVRSLMNMGFVHFFNCDYELATRTCLDAMRLLRPNMLEVDAAALWYNIALSHHHQTELNEALVYLDKFLDVAVSYLGVRHLQVATALHRKGLICFEMGNLYDSTKPMLQALRIRKRQFGNMHPLVADSLCLLGKIYLDREEFRFAQNALLQALTVLRSLNEEDHLCLDIAQALIDLGRACHSQGQVDESLKAYLEAVSLTKKMFGDRHAYVARMKNIVGNLFLEQGEVDQAVEFFARSMRIQVGEGRPVDFNIVQNPHVRVKFSHRPTSASA